MSPKKKAGFNDAHAQAEKQRSISVSEFFSKNRHLLGFDNPRRALLTAVKEAVDNSLDACEDAGILPEIRVGLKDSGNGRFIINVEDNGPGIVKTQIPNIFGRLLYGSKFHSMKMSRGQQGIGISAAGMYGQLTTGKPIKITSKIGKGKPAHHYHLHLNTTQNKPEVLKDAEIEWTKDHGTQVELELEGAYLKGRQSVDEYLRQTAIANPHVTLHYQSPLQDDAPVVFKRVSDKLPDPPKEIKPHPYGVELGMLMKMLKTTSARSLKGFLQSDFSRVSPKVAEEICKAANLNPNAKPTSIANNEADTLYRSIQKVKIMNPPTDCITPIGEELIISGLKKEMEADIFVATTRPPAVYRGNPFIIEAGIAFGGKLPGDQLAQIFRVANRVPLQYQQSACAIFKAVQNLDWKNYGLDQARGALPTGPLVILVHMASVWVPFTSESKEAIASYDEIAKEIRLALQECGRKIGEHINRQRRYADALKKKNYIQMYIPQIGIALKEILDLSDKETDKTVKNLIEVLEKSRKL
ncbi:MAG: DNA topoisomerase VI subunit B [Elusimicrobia bacterium RIFOXYB2_FULL_49_7]|nr:MAG: DNA topoisomerase VI subunit B [Elusimicrobia bacterium RIFOXYB2_FULL_49_7]